MEKCTDCKKNQFGSSDVVVIEAVVKDVILSGEEELAVVTMDLKLCTLLVIVLSDVNPSRQEFGAVLTEVVL